MHLTYLACTPETKDALGIGSPLHSLPEFNTIEADEYFNLMLSSNCLSKGVRKVPEGSIRYDNCFDPWWCVLLWITMQLLLTPPKNSRKCSLPLVNILRPDSPWYSAKAPDASHRVQVILYPTPGVRQEMVNFFVVEQWKQSWTPQPSNFHG